MASDFFFSFLFFLAVFYLWCISLSLESIRMQQAMASGESLTRVTDEEVRVRRREEEEEEEVIQVKVERGSSVAESGKTPPHST